MPQPSEAVLERKTRPIYDALNRGDSKVDIKLYTALCMFCALCSARASAIVARVRARQPNSRCAVAWRDRVLNSAHDGGAVTH